MIEQIFSWLASARRFAVGVLLALVIPAIALAAAPSTPENRLALWQLIHEHCVPAAMRGHFPPTPCTEINIASATSDGYAVFKDRNGRYQYLVLPLARVTGIEDPALLAADAPNYFADAWIARQYLEAALHRPLPREIVSLAVNSPSGRTQDQLHIHINCLRADVQVALQRQLAGIGPRWQVLPEKLPPYHHQYQAMWLAGDVLSANPFKLLAASLPAGEAMAMHSLLVIGSQRGVGQPGFILLSGHVDPATGDKGSGGELQDNQCGAITAATR